MKPATAGRIEWLDLLRGIAVAGMLMVHVAGAAHGSGDAYQTWTASFDFLAKGKFYTIFALLFGVSFAIQNEKVPAGRSLSELFWRRLAGLALIMLALQILFGSSLFYYAIWGAPLLFFRRLSSRTLAVVALLLLMVQPFTMAADGIYRVRTAGTAAATANTRAELAERRAAALSTAAQTTLTDRFQARVRQFQPSRALTMANVIRFQWGAFALAMFIVGLLAVRHGVLREPGAHRPMLLGVAAVCVALALGRFALERFWNPGFAFPVFNAVATQGLGLLRTEWLGVAYASLLLLVLSRHGRLPILRPLASVGRTALSNYALHLLFIEVLFARWSLGLPLDWRLVLPAAAAIFSVQALLTSWWLRHHSRGPLEHFWRMLTFGRAEIYARRFASSRRSS